MRALILDISDPLATQRHEGESPFYRRCSLQRRNQIRVQKCSSTILQQRRAETIKILSDVLYRQPMKRMQSSTELLVCARLCARCALRLYGADVMSYLGLLLYLFSARWWALNKTFPFLVNATNFERPTPTPTPSLLSWLPSVASA